MTSIRRRAATLLVVPLLGSLVACARGPGSTARQFVKATASGNITEALSLLSTRFVGTMGEPKVRTVLERAAAQARQQKGLRSVDVQRETRQGELAEVVLRSAYGDGNASVDTLQMLAEGGRWKVDPRLRK